MHAATLCKRETESAMLHISCSRFSILSSKYEILKMLEAYIELKNQKSKPENDREFNFKSK